jgi:hypothetical protein
LLFSFEKRLSGNRRSLQVLKLHCSAALLLLLLFFSEGSAFAGSLNVQFVNAGTWNHGGAFAMGGVYVGPYTISVNGQQMMVICDDAISEVYTGETWQAAASTIAGGLGQAKWTGVTINAGVDGNASKAVLSQFQEYQAIQYLAQLMMANISNPTTVGEIQWAIWDLTAPGTINQSNGSEHWGNLSAYLGSIDSYILAGINNDRGNGSHIVIYTPTTGGTCGLRPCGTPQEYIQVTPEPASLTLVGTGLLAVAGSLHRKKLLS